MLDDATWRKFWGFEGIRMGNVLGKWESMVGGSISPGGGWEQQSPATLDLGSLKVQGGFLEGNEQYSVLTFNCRHWIGTSTAVTCVFLKVLTCCLCSILCVMA